MNSSPPARVFVVASLALCPLAQVTVADPSAKPYQWISTRNVFQLKPPQVVPTEQVRPLLPKLTLTGITTILVTKRVLLKAEFPASPPEPARERSYILAEGQRAGPIEIVEIDEQAGRVSLRVMGEAMVLTFEDNGPKPSTTTTPAMTVMHGR